MSEERDPVLRASDADRDAVADRLRAAHTEGRLSVEEFGERLDAAFAARTTADLARLTTDLPAPTQAPARTGDEPTTRPPARRERPRGVALPRGLGHLADRRPGQRGDLGDRQPRAAGMGVLLAGLGRRAVGGGAARGHPERPVQPPLRR